jgi:hypothetical protein
MANWFSKLSALWCAPKSFGQGPKAASTRLRTSNIETLENRDMMTFRYEGGALMPHVQAQAVYMGPEWRTDPMLRSEHRKLDPFVQYVVKSPFMDILHDNGYRVWRGTASPSVYGPEVRGYIKDEVIQGKLQELIAARKVEQPNPNRLYMVFLPPDVEVIDGTSTSIDDFVAYHGAYAGKNADGKSVDIRYAVMPHPGGINGSPESIGFRNNLDVMTYGMSHELAEAATDPDVLYKKLGWYDEDNNGEVADFADNRGFRLNGYMMTKLSTKNGVQVGPKVTATTQTQSAVPQSAALVRTRAPEQSALSGQTAVLDPWSTIQTVIRLELGPHGAVTRDVVDLLD